MKIKILTIHCIPNFGSVFQCYALYSFIKNIGYKDVEVIDYRPSYFVPHSLRSLAAMFIHIDKYVKRKRKFDSFIENNIKLSNKIYYSYDQLKNANIQADILIAGGDQLWNPYHECGRDNAYKLTFSDNKKISYNIENIVVAFYPFALFLNSLLKFCRYLLIKKNLNPRLDIQYHKNLFHHCYF